MKKYLWTLLAFVLFIGFSCQDKTFIEKDSTNDLKMELESLNGSSLKNSKSGKGGNGGKNDNGRPKLREGTNVGDMHEGGIIFKIMNPDSLVADQYGLICALSGINLGAKKNRVTLLPWGGMNVLIPVTEMNEDWGGGQDNTEAIIKKLGQLSGTAAFECEEYSTEYMDGSRSITVYKDWYFPNLLELKEVYKMAKEFGVGRFVYSQYSSSTQINKDHADGVCFFFLPIDKYPEGLSFSEFIANSTTGLTNRLLEKSNDHFVHPVRKFGDWTNHGN